MVHTIEVGTSKSVPARRTARRVAVLLGVAGMALAGCETDSFIDPSVTGRWEWTPATVPVLERIAAIEDASGDLVEYSDVTPADLIPDPSEYRIGPGDRLQITLFDDINNSGVPSTYERDVDIRGTIDLPQLGQINLTNRTVEQSKLVIAQTLSRFVNDPLVSVVVVAQRQQTFNTFGAVDQPGPYFISKPDYRLLEALTASGRLAEGTTEEIYVIRQIPLNDAVRGMVPTPAAPAPTEPGAATTPAPAGQPTTTPPAPKTDPKDSGKLIDLIDQLSGEKPAEKKPDQPPVDPKNPSLSVMSDPNALARPERRRTARSPQGTTQPPAEQPAAKPTDRPPVDLVDQSPAKPANGTAPATKPGGSSWVFVHGEWVQIKGAGTGTTPAAPGQTPSQIPGVQGSDQLMTQRVIRIPAKPLFAGLAQYNIVIRPGDIIHVPPIIDGFVYMEGQVARPGPYTLPAAGRLTLRRAIASAGGLSSLAIPERLDLTRVVGKNKQATIRLDYRAIAEGTMPDIYMRPDDIVNMGTNFWAYPLAVFRNGLRMSYGFGFVIDRNFDIEVFGPQPLRQSN